MAIDRAGVVRWGVVLLAVAAVVPGALAADARGPRKPKPAGSPGSAASCIAPPSALVAWWPGDDNGRDLVAGRDAVLVAGAGFTPGMVLDGFDFDGASWAEVADDPALTLTGDFTIDLWARFGALGGRDPLIAHDEGGGASSKWIFWYDESGHDKIPGTPALRFHLNSPHPGPLPFAHDAVAAPWSPQVGVWYHLAVTRAGTTYSLYVDGALLGSDTSPYTIPDPSAPVTIGRAESFRLTGAVDEVEWHGRALSEAEIAAIHAAGAAGKCKTGFLAAR